MIKNKKIILFFGCLVIFFPGAFVFGYPGVMPAQWQSLFGATKKDLGSVLFFMLGGTGFAMYLAGKLQEKIKYHFLIFTGSLVISLAMFFVGRAQSIYHVYLWAFVSGFFTGFIYVPMLTVFQKAFPFNKGLVTGIINLTFGGAAALFSPVFSYLLVNKGYAFTSDFAGIVSLLFGTSAALLIKLPEAQKEENKEISSVLTLKATVKLKSFWILWFVWAFAGAAGISMIVNGASFGIKLGFDVTSYVYILIGFNMMNGAGRLICGRLSDSFNKQKILMTVFLISAAAYLLLAFSTNIVVISCLAALVGLAFGALFTVSAPLVVECFGIDNFGKVFGLVFTAYGFCAGLIGPWLSGMMLDLTNGNFKIVFFYFAALLTISAFLILKVRAIDL